MTIKECWNFIGWEPFFPITWEQDFSQICSFCRMLMNNKNVPFTQIPDKTNDIMFLKSQKHFFEWPKKFLGHFRLFFVIFAQWGFFPKCLAVTHNYIWAPNTILCFWKTLQTEGWTEGQKDRPYFIGPFRLRPGIQKSFEISGKVIS